MTDIKSKEKLFINGIRIHALFDELMPIEKLLTLFHPKNNNKHNDTQKQQLASIFKYSGFRKPVKISTLSGKITTGHCQTMSAKIAGMEKVPIVYQDYENEDMEYADITSDNAIALQAEIDMSMVNFEVQNFSPDFDTAMLGFENFTIDMSEKHNDENEDNIPEIAEDKPTVSKECDLWLLGNHRLLCGDCTEKQNIEKLMNGEKAVLWSSDPPYGINHVETSQEKGQSKGYSKIYNDEKQDQELQDFIFKTINVSIPYLKDNFAFYMWHAMKMQGYFAAAAAAAAAAGNDILFHRQIIWKKERFVFGRGHYHWKHELCLMGWRQGKEPPFYGERNQTTVWEVSRENDKIHPTQKPIILFEIPILNHTKQNEIIYEPFAGSGSNIIASEKNKRKCYALELSKHYCDVIIERFQTYSGKEVIREDGKTYNQLKQDMV